MRFPALRALQYIILSILVLSAVSAAPVDLYKMKVYVDGDRVWDIDDFESVFEVQPLDTITVTMGLENPSEEVDLEEMEIVAVLAGIDDGDDLEYESDEFEIDAEDKHILSFDMELPLEIDEGDYTLTITINGEDEDSNSLNLPPVTLTARVTFETHRVKLTSSFEHESIECGNENVLHLTASNIGAKDIDDMRIFVESEELGMYQLSDYLELESQDDEDGIYTTSYAFDVPKNIPSGDYQLHVTPHYRWYDEDEEFHTAQFVVACEIEPLHKEVITVMPKSNEENKKAKQIIILDDAPTGLSVAEIELLEDVDSFVEAYKFAFVIASAILFVLLISIFYMVSNE